MFYEPPQLQGKIRKIKRSTNKLNSTIGTGQIFMSERLVYDGELREVRTRKEAIEVALRIAKQIKKEALLQIELKAVGEELYVKWVDLELVNGGSEYCAVFIKECSSLL